MRNSSLALVVLSAIVPSPTSPLFHHDIVVTHRRLSTRSLPGQHPRNRVGGADMQPKLIFCGRRYPSLVRIQSPNGIRSVPCAEPTFHAASQREARVCSQWFRDFDLPSRYVKYPRDPNPPIPTPVKLPTSFPTHGPSRCHNSRSPRFFHLRYISRNLTAPSCTYVGSSAR